MENTKPEDKIEPVVPPSEQKIVDSPPVHKKQEIPKVPEPVKKKNKKKQEVGFFEEYADDFVLVGILTSFFLYTL